MSDNPHVSDTLSNNVNSKLYPSDIIPGLYQWKIQLPVDIHGNGSAGVSSYKDRNTNAMEVSGYNLVHYEYPPYFYVADSEVVFQAPCWGATTSGSNYPRSELRQLVGGGDNYWSLNQYQYLETVLRVTHLPDKKPDVCFTQIHAPGHSEPLRIHFNANKGLYIVSNTTNHYYIKDQVPYSLGQELLVKVVVDHGNVTCFIENLSNGKQTIRTWQSVDTLGYFKVGCYTQSSIFLSQFKPGYQNENMDAYGEVRVRKLSVVQTYN
ncbi:MAG: polysaccharide lyase family 7 protein [Acidobacterium ailaaui]|nr:polysaccharide lyase family 7 protein [Pseudacidobacterium ailaaui]